MNGDPDAKGSPEKGRSHMLSLIGLGMLLSVAVLVVGSQQSVAEAGSLVTSTTKPPWTLERLGRQDILFVPSERQEESRNVLFELPAGAKQGRAAWYLLRLHYRIEIAPASGNGQIEVVGRLNGRAAVLQIYYVKRTSAGLRVKWTELSLVKGFRSAVTRSLEHETTVRNYVPDAGVHPGQSMLTFAVKQHGEARFKSVRVFANSGAELSGLDPPELALEIGLSKQTVQVGDRFTVSYEVANKGGITTPRGEIGLMPLDGAVSPVDSASQPLPPVSAGGKVRGRLRLQARRPGSWLLLIQARTATASQLASVSVRVLR